MDKLKCKINTANPLAKGVRTQKRVHFMFMRKMHCSLCYMEWTFSKNNSGCYRDLHFRNKPTFNFEWNFFHFNNPAQAVRDVSEKTCVCATNAHNFKAITYIQMSNTLCCSKRKDEATSSNINHHKVDDKLEWEVTGWLLSKFRSRSCKTLWEQN